MNARFYAPDAREVKTEIVLPDDEAQHLSRVLRLEAGRFPGGVQRRRRRIRGGGRRGRQRRASRCASCRAPTPLAELPIALTLAQAVLKGDKMDGVIRDAVMLGVAAVQPIVTARCEVTLATLTRGGRVDRWHRVAVSSAKQCGRAVVPAIAPPIAFDGPASLAHLPSPQFILVEPGATEQPGTRERTWATSRRRPPRSSSGPKAGGPPAKCGSARTTPIRSAWAR